MKFGYSETCLEHDTGDRHPENPDRLRAIKQGLARKHGVEYVDPDPADVETVKTVHDADYVEEVREFCEGGGGNWDPDTIAVGETWDAAMTSAGLAVWAAEAALDGDQDRQTPFSLGRPPGHHATEDDAMGFCFINNAAVAAESALERVDRVAIVDWDVHHGNGTQDIFDDRGDVFYASLHEQGLYPGTGAADEIGVGEGEGTVCNVPLPAGTDDGGYLYAIDEVLAPAIERFDPELLLVSAGFDSHRHDPISRMRVSTDGFGHQTIALREIADDADAPIAFVLEGGYGLDTLSDGVAMVHETFDGLTPVDPEIDPSDDVEEIVSNLRERHGLGS